MHKEIFFVKEGLPTFTALRIFSSVDFLVLNKCILLKEGFPTLITLIGSFSSVDSLVLNKFIFVGKHFPTITALIKPFSCVNLPMVSKTGGESKELPAVTALIRFFTSVNSQVVREFILLTEGFATFAALVMPFPRVRDLPALPACTWVLSIVGGLVWGKAQAA